MTMPRTRHVPWMPGPSICYVDCPESGGAFAGLRSVRPFARPRRRAGRPVRRQHRAAGHRQGDCEVLVDVVVLRWTRTRRRSERLPARRRFETRAHHHTCRSTVIVNELGLPVFARFTVRARQVIVLAQDEARSSTTIPGTEHILLGCSARRKGSPHGCSNRSKSRPRKYARSCRRLSRAPMRCPGQLLHPAVEEGARARAARGASGHNYTGTRAHPARLPAARAKPTRRWILGDRGYVTMAAPLPDARPWPAEEQCRPRLWVGERVQALLDAGAARAGARNREFRPTPAADAANARREPRARRCSDRAPSSTRGRPPPNPGRTARLGGTQIGEAPCRYGAAATVALTAKMPRHMNIDDVASGGTLCSACRRTAHDSTSNTTDTAHSSA